MPQVEESILVNCPRERAFRFTTDPVNAGRYDPNIIQYVQVDSGRPGVGSRLSTVARVAGRRLESVMEIVEFDPPERWVIKTLESPVDFSISVSFFPVDDITSITWRVKFQGLGSFFAGLGDQVVTEIYARDLRSTLQELKEILESDVS